MEDNAREVEVVKFSDPTKYEDDEYDFRPKVSSAGDPDPKDSSTTEPAGDSVAEVISTSNPATTETSVPVVKGQKSGSSEPTSPGKTKQPA